MKFSVLEVPPVVVTLTDAMPMPSGATTVIEVPVALTFTPAISVDPKLTVESGVNPLPSRTTTVPPAAVPEEGAMLVITGAYENCPAVTAVPPLGVTVTWTVPAPAGDVAVIAVPAAFMLTEAAGTEPNSTVSPVVNPFPLMITDVPPAAGPAVGVIPVTTGT